MLRLIQYVPIVFLLGCSQTRPKVSVRVPSKSSGFIEIPAGTFLMGSDELSISRPVHEVQLDSFEIMIHEVTNEQVEECPALKGRDRGDWSKEDRAPACGLTGAQVQRFIDWKNTQGPYTYRLPTESEWEYAARGGLKGKDYPWGNDFSEDLAWVGQNRAKAVMSFPSNGYGLFDMCGNASELTIDGDGDYSAGKKVNPPPRPNRDGMSVVRGIGGRLTMPWVWMRSPHSDAIADTTLGFRLVRKST